MKRYLPTDQRGTILLVFLITLPFLILTTMYYMSLSLTSIQVAHFDQLHTEAQLAADAGADQSIEQFSQDNTWTGTTGPVQIHSDAKLRTTYTASLSGDNKTKVLAVTGNAYQPVSATTPSRTVKIYVDLRPVTSGQFSIVSGEGGLVMSNKAKIVGGDVFVNGGITLSNSAQIGLSTNPINVKVANQRCPIPADSTYPRVCNSGEGGQPISIDNTAHIYGTVQAVNQTDGSNMSNPGLTSGSPAPQALPTYDRAAQKAAVTTNLTGDAASCSSGSVTWQANTKITGDVSITNKCQVTVKGDVWITGNFSLANSSQLIVADSLGSTMSHLMIDGSSGASFLNSSTLVPNATGTGFEILTYYCGSGCSVDSSSVTGTQLATSRSLTTITLNNSGDETGTIFYAYWSQVSVQNSGQIGALIGQTINLSNTGTVTFTSSTGTGSTTWVVKGYRRQ